jgi:23S rRNA (adenine2030-N6)-methyltransferase
MLSYRHSYHAGNHADVLKHAVLALLVEALKKKDTPFAYLETHAGAGRYDLRSEQAQKTGEFHAGIARLWDATPVPDALSPYLDAVHALNPEGQLLFYPGSPRVARHLIRPQDRMVLMELHTNEYPVLKQEFAGDRQVAVHHRNGYEGLRGLVPPKEKRGLLLIDPSYEVAAEYGQVVEAVEATAKRWASGILAIWYPLLTRAAGEAFKERFRAAGLRKLLGAEITVRDEGIGMFGSGMLILNPPWQLDATLQQLLPWIAEILAPHAGTSRVEWVVPE